MKPPFVPPEPRKFASGRAGHYGVPGMHEHAKLVGGKLVVWSKPGSGTEVELTAPASIAYSKSEKVAV